MSAIAVVLLLPFSYALLLFIFSSLIGFARISSTVFVRNSKNDYPYLFPNLRGKEFGLLPLNVMLTVGFLEMALSA